MQVSLILAWGLAGLSAAIWLTLVLFRGGFWLARERDDDAVPARPGDAPEAWPSVVAVVPARDEADVVARSVASLCGQDYPGPFRIMVVDDQSTDATAQAARRAGGDDTGVRLEIITGSAPPPGWTGKLWALNQGVVRDGRAGDAPDYYLFTDADIAHRPDHLRRLVAQAEAGGLVLTSKMVRLNCETLAERLLIPAFVFFFQMLYPFAWVNRPGRATAAAAGGCMLVQSAALEAVGGLDAVSGAIIDDCALARRLKRQGPIWLGLTSRAVSIRPYDGMGEIRRMIARSAYAQLGYSPVLLFLVLVFMVLTYLAPPMLALFAQGGPRLIGAAVWMLMALAFQPILRIYRRSPLWGLLLPVIAGFYIAFTVDSALQYWRGRGGMWKGRVQVGQR